MCAERLIADADFEIIAGETPTFQIIVNRTDYTTAPPTVTPVDLRLGSTEIAFSAKYERADANPLFTKTLGVGVNVPNVAPGNLMQVTLAPSDTAGIVTDTRLVYTVRVTEPTGIVTDVAWGFLLVRARVA